MSKTHPLINSRVSWDLSALPDYIAAWPGITNEVNCLSSINATGTVQLNGYITKSILEYAMGSDAEICVISVGDDVFASEWKQPDGKYMVAVANSKGMLNASIVNALNWQCSTISGIGSNSDATDYSPILALYLQIYCLDDGSAAHADAKQCLDECRSVYSQSQILPRDAVYRLNDYLQTALQNGDLPTGVASGGISILSNKRIQSGALDGAVLCGHSEILSPKAKPAAVFSGSCKVAEAKQQFRAYADTRTWSPEEELRIRAFPDDYIVPGEVIEMAQWFIDSRGTNLPATNMCWRGVTGCGKSTGAALLSCILHTPLYIMTCSSSMETADFLSALIPATRPSYFGPLPDIEAIWMDPEAAYEAMTGTQLPGVSSQETLEKYGEICASNSGKSTYYKRVNSEYVRALETGAIVEIQEFSRIRDSGVLVGLNEYDHAGALIPLVDGTYVTRHPDAICLWTDNLGYNSCRTVDPSVMRRMTMVTDTFDLEKKDVVDRVMYNTGNALERKTVEAMFEVWQAIRDFCEHEDIAEGDLSPSDLENWAARTVKTGLSTAKDIVRKCLISKLTTDRETQERIIASAASVAMDKWIAPLL